MSELAIAAESLGKRYRIGELQAPYETLRDTIASAVAAPVRALRNQGTRGNTREFWALRDVSFEVRRGEVLGIIGRNGAGKSTLLKILSRVTAPTTGRAIVRGRVGSLLEVGTGFHPELSGRENIYLNGAILGMSRSEIARKFDEIVAFAEIEQFLDTPIKRYSTGMYMRLAFSVAAHLEPEILVVDEVLAVGDAAFQRKCLGKMSHVAQEGRTVVFVSHNMPAMLALCDRACLLSNGQIRSSGDTAPIVQEYLNDQHVSRLIPLEQRRDRDGNGDVRIVSLRVESNDPDRVIRSTSQLRVTLGYQSESPVRHAQFVVSIYDDRDFGVFLLHNEFVGGLPEVLPAEGSVTCVTGPINLTPGQCVVHLEVLKGNVREDFIPDAAIFDVHEDAFYPSGMMPPRDWSLGLLPQEWKLNHEAEAAADALQPNGGLT